MKTPGFVCGFLLFSLAPALVVAAERVTIEVNVSKDGQTKQHTEIITIDGDRFRLDQPDAADSEGQKPFLLTIDGGKSWVFGDVVKDSYYCATVDMNEFFREVGDLVNYAEDFVNADVAIPDVEKVLDEPGEEIAGYTTRHVRMVSTISGKGWLFFFRYEYKVVKTDDVWYTTEREVHPARRSWMEALTGSGYEKLDQMFAQWYGSLPGPVLRHDMDIRLINVKKDRTKAWTESARVVSVEEVALTDLPADLFTPPDCEKIGQDELEEVAKKMYGAGHMTF